MSKAKQLLVQMVLLVSLALWTQIMSTSALSEVELPKTYGPQSLILIDSSLEGSAELVAEFSGLANVALIDPQLDGIIQVSQILARFDHIQSLHILSHGEEGRIWLGNSILDEAILVDRRDELLAWRASLTSNADLLLYGCDVAANSNSFIREFSTITGTDIAASTNPTGIGTRGGDWVLEARTGPIESRLLGDNAVAQQLDVVLAIPAGFTDELVVDNLSQPVDVTVLPTGEMLVLERGGTIIFTDPSVTPAVASTYLQLPNTDSAGEKGLLGITLDPEFTNNNYFYVYYHNTLVDRARISRFIHDVDHANLVDEFVIWEDDFPTANQLISDHWGGGLDFGPDGLLYLTIGDKKDFPEHAQDLTKTAGKILRFDPAGADSGAGPWIQGSDNPHLVPDGNPYIDGPGGNADEVWAIGLRNPFRAKWDLLSGRFFIGEVGGNIQSGVDASHEDIHMVTVADATANFGWPDCEGPDCVGGNPSNYSPPIFSIQHPDTRSITMGPVYHGSLFPSAYSNVLFFADFSRGWLRYLTFDGSGNVSTNVPVGGFKFSGNGDLGAPVAFAVGNDDALYYVDIIGRNAVGGGQLRRITYSNSNAPPVITQASADVANSATAPLVVEFTGVATDPEGQTLTFDWDFGDGTQGTGPVVSHTYTAKGAYNAVLRVSDNLRTATADPVLIEVGQAPIPSIDNPVDGSLFRAGDLIQIRGSGTDGDGILTNDDFSWTVRFQHDLHFHPVLFGVTGIPCPPTGSTCIDITIPDFGHDFSDNSGFEIRLDVIDSDGISGTNTVSILPDKVDLTIDSNVPGGVTVFIDGLPRTGPLILDTLIGYQHTISVPGSVVSGGDTYVFSFWSNGPTTPSQSFVVPDSNATYTATYINIGPANRVSNGIQVLYTFDEGVNDTVFDTSGVGSPINLTIADPANVSWGAGTLSINASTIISSGGAASKLNSAIPASNEITVEAWIAPANNTQTGPSQIVSISDRPFRRNVTLGQGDPGGAPGTFYNVRLRTTTTGKNGINPALNSPPDSLVTTRTHVVYTRDTAGNANVYINNVLVSSLVIGGDLSNWAGGFPLELANEQSGDRAWLGTFDLVAIYDRALSTAEVNQNFAAGAAGSGNLQPNAQNDDFLTDENTSVNGNVLADNANGPDNDPEGDVLTVSAVNGSSAAVGSEITLASGATVTVNTNGDFSYDPNGQFNGLAQGEQDTDSFGYTISDGNLGSDSATVSLTIDGVGAGNPFVFSLLRSSTYSLFNPHDIKLSADGKRLFVPDVENDRIVVLDSDTLSFISQWGSDHQDGTHDVDFDAAGRLHVADTFNNRVTIYDIHPTTGIGTLVDQLSDPILDTVEGVLVHPNGRVYVTAVASNNLAVFEGGVMVASSDFAAVGGLSFPHDVEVTSSGNIWMADSENDRMLLFDPDTLTVLDELSGPSYRFNGIRYQDIMQDGTLIAADKDTHSIKVIANDGTLLQVLGNEGVPGFGPGQFTTPEGVEIMGNVVWLSDSGNDRVVKYWMVPTGSDPAPLAQGDLVAVTDGGSVVIDVLFNDVDDSALNPATVVPTNPANGSVSVNTTTGEITYTHNGSGPGTDTFTYVVNDDTGQTSNVATVTVMINAVTGLPTGGLVLRLESDAGVATTGSTVTAWADQSGMGNDLNGSGDPQLLAASPNGQLVIDFDGAGDKLERLSALNGLPAGNSDRTMFVVVNYRANGPGGFAYGTNNCNQAFGLIVNRKLGRLMVQGWCDDFNSRDAGAGQGWMVQSVIHNGGQMTHYRDGTQIDSRTHDYNTVLSKMVVGAELDSNPFMDMQVAAILVYDRALDATEHADVLNYMQTKFIDAAPTNMPPTANDDPLSTVMVGGVIDIDVLLNDTDIDGALDVTTVSVQTPPTLGTAVENLVTGKITYTHTVGGSGTDTFTYAVNDDDGAPSNVATVTVTINAPNVPPIANDDPLVTVTEGGTVDIDVLLNDADSDGTLNAATVAVQTPPTLGTAVENLVTGEITYTHTGSGTGTDTFTYLVRDDDGVPSNIATVTVTIEPPNVPPVANNDPLAMVTEGGTVDIDVLFNDFDSDGTLNAATVAVQTAPTQGTAVENLVTGEIMYTHTGTGTGTDMFTYTVNDDDGDSSNVAIVTVTIEAAPNVPPVANNDPLATVTEGGTVNIDVLLNDVDSDGTLNVATVAVQTAPTQGTAVEDLVTGAIMYTHTGTGTGTDMFTYTVNDNDGDPSNIATVSVTIEPPNVPPVANNDPLATVTEGGTVDIDVLFNDADSDGTLDVTTVTVQTAPTLGTAIENPVTGEITYTHTGSGTGTDMFTYTVNDDDGDPSNVAIVTVTIEAAPSFPVGGLVLHLEADTGVLTSGSTVNGWTDQSAQGNDLVSGGDPQMLDFGLNGQPVIAFDGVGDKLERIGGLNGLPTGASDRTVYIVVRYDGVGHGGFAWGTGVGPPYSCNQVFGLIVNPTGRLMIQGWCNDFDSGDPGTGQGWLVQSALLESGQVSHYQNGFVIDTRVHAYNTILSNLVVGAEIDSDPFVNMRVAAIFVYDRALSSIEQDQLQAYLQSKYFDSGGGDSPPFADDDSVAVTDGGSVVIDVLFNDVDDSALNPATVVPTSPANGSVSVNTTTGEITYTHNGSGPGTDTFTYVVNDDTGQTSNVATVTVMINAVTGLPTGGLVLRLESDAGVAMTGSTVTAWADQSGMGNDLNGSGDPQLLAASPNGQLVIDFDGTGDKLERLSALNGLPTGNANRTMFVVVNYRANGPGGIAYGTKSCNQAFGLIVNRKKGRLMVQGWCDDFNSRDAGAGQGWMVQSVIHNGGQMTHYRDGNQIDSRVHDYNTVLSKIVVGAEIDSNPFMDMQVAAILVYDRALDATEHDNVLNYLQLKFIGN